MIHCEAQILFVLVVEIVFLLKIKKFHYFF